ncbi:MAG: 50S ribosomal protein L10 [Planctomycetales bacterium]|nr:50S ribosomal protein L10 [Planctomycetales bacterium]
MSKYVKNLIARDISNRLEGVQDAILVNVIGMDSASSYSIRKRLRDSGIQMLTVKRSLAARATADSTLRPMFDGQAGSVSVVWGCEDFVSLAKAIVEIGKSPEFAKFELKGGVMDGDGLTGEQVAAVSKWPNRQEQISILVGQILNPGATLSGQFKGAGSKLAGQLKTMIEKKEGEA